MPEQENFRDLVEVEWNISQPEGAIAVLLAKLEELERRFDSVSRAARRAGAAAGGANSNTGSAYSPPPAGAEYVVQRRYPAGTPGGLGGRYAPAGFDNVSSSGPGPSGLGAQYVGDGPIPRYRFINSEFSYVSNSNSMGWSSPNASYLSGASQNTGWASNAFLLGSGKPNWTFSSGPGPMGIMPVQSGAGFGGPPLLGSGGGGGGSGQFGAGWSGFAGGWGAPQSSAASGATIGANYTGGYYGGGGGGAGGIGNVANGFNNASGAVSNFNNQFIKHLAWIGQGILIWGALHTVVNAAKAGLQEAINLENVQARTGFINGSSLGDVSSDIIQGARYGIGSATAGQGAIVGGQLNLSPTKMDEGRRLSLIFGADQYTNALRELYQTEQRANAVGTEHVNVMGYIASAYKEAPGTLESYFDALQQGILLSHDLGVSAEAAGLSILRMSEATEDSPERIATTIQSVVSNLRQAKTQDDLKAYGITPGDAPDMLRQVAAEVTNLVSSGNLEQAKSLIDQVTGGLNAPTRRLQLLTDFQELNKLFTEGNKSLENMDELLKGIGDTGQASFERLKASFTAYVDATLAANMKQGGLSMATQAGMEWGALGPLALLDPKFYAKLYGGGKEMAGQTADYFDREALYSNYRASTGNEAITHTPGEADLDKYDFNHGGFYGETDAFKKWLKENGLNPEERYGKRNLAKPFAPSPNAATGGAGGPTGPLYEFGGFQTAGKGWDWNKFEKDVRSQETLLGGVRGYTVDQKEVAFWDEATQSYKMMIGDLNAIRFATDEQRKLLQQQITGTFNVPAGGEALVQYYALAAGIGPSTGGGTKAVGGGTSVTGSNNSWNNVINYYGGTTDPFKNNFVGSSDDPLGDPFSGIPPEFLGSARNSASGKSDRLFGKHSDRDALLGPGGGRSTTGKAIQDSFRKSNNEQASKLGAMTVNNTIRVYIDGRQVSHAVQRQNYRSFENIRNSAFSAPSNQVAI